MYNIDLNRAHFRKKQSFIFSNSQIGAPRCKNAWQEYTACLALGSKMRRSQRHTYHWYHITQLNKRNSFLRHRYQLYKCTTAAGLQVENLSFSMNSYVRWQVLATRWQHPPVLQIWDTRNKFELEHIVIGLITDLFNSQVVLGVASVHVDAVEM